MNAYEIGMAAVAVVSGGLGFFGCALVVNQRLREIRKETWAAAARFYAMKAEEERERSVG